MKPMTAREVSVELSRLETTNDGADARMHHLSADLNRGKRWRRHATRLSIVAALAIALIVRGESWNDSDLIIASGLIVGLPALAILVVRSVFPALQNEDRIEALARHFNNESDTAKA